MLLIVKYTLLNLILVIVSCNQLTNSVCDNLLSPLYCSKGLGNYIVEFKNYALISHFLNRRLCLLPFYEGKTIRDKSQRKVTAEKIESYYDMDELKKFVNLESYEVCSKCMQSDHYVSVTLNSSAEVSSLEDFYLLPEVIQIKSTRMHVQLKQSPPCLKSFPFMSSGIRSITQLYLKPSSDLIRAGNYISKTLAVPFSTMVVPSIGMNNSRSSGEWLLYNFTCVHWRFEETKCRGMSLGLCQVIRGGIYQFDYTDIVDALRHVQAKERSETILLITDGRMRDGAKLVNRVKAELGMVELRDINTLQDALNFLHIKGFSSPEAALPALERQVCKSAAVVIGTEHSTFTLDIFENNVNSAMQYKNSSLKSTWRDLSKLSFNASFSKDLYLYPHQYVLQNIEKELHMTRMNVTELNVKKRFQATGHHSSIKHHMKSIFN